MCIVIIKWILTICWLEFFEPFYFSSLFNFPYENVILCWKDLKVRYQVDWWNSFTINIFNKKIVLKLCWLLFLQAMSNRNIFLFFCDSQCHVGNLFDKKVSYGCLLGCWVGCLEVGLFVGCFLMWECRSSLLHGQDLCGQGLISPPPPQKLYFWLSFE
jgi:hypothetical protein